MLKKEDKDGIIEFLIQRIQYIRDNAASLASIEDEFGCSCYHMNVSELEDLCDKTLMEVSF